MLGGTIASSEFFGKISNPWVLNWKKGSVLKFSSIGIGQMEKFVKHGAHRKRKSIQVIFFT